MLVGGHILMGFGEAVLDSAQQKVSFPSEIDADFDFAFP